MKSAIETDEMKKWCEIRSLEKIQEKCLKRKELKLGFSIQSHCFVCDTKENEDIEIVAQFFLIWPSNCTFGLCGARAEGLIR